jgi:hypothetical protein
MRWMVPVAALMLVGGCKYKVERFCDDDTPCTDPERPFCDRNGGFPASEGIGNQCIPDPRDPDAGPGLACEPSTISCSDGIKTTCGDDGTVDIVETCVLGCASPVDCALIEPSNGHGPLLADAQLGPEVTLTDGAVINTDTGLIRNGDGTAVTVPFVALDAPPGTGKDSGVPLGVFGFRSLVLENVTVEGTAALVLLSYNEVSIRGILDLAAESGPASGALLGCEPRGCAEGSTVDFRSPGSAGGCFNSSLGGLGGGGGSGGGFTCANSSCNSGRENLVPLRGGCGGGAADGSNREGGGGGAVQIVSNAKIIVEDNGGIVAGGAGGFRDDGGLRSGGAGGGAGGGILLEAPDVVFMPGSGLAANGGGGGSYVNRGADADSITLAPAAGGPGNVNKGGGGEGASVSAPDAPGGEGRTGETGDPDDPATADAGGGGGGTVGRIRINTLAGDLEMPGGVIFSPPPSVGELPVATLSPQRR